MRTLSVGSFADKGAYYIPESIEKSAFKREYEHHMMQVQDLYNRWIKGGIMMEDAREILPLATAHRLTWGTNLAAMIHIVGERTCFMFQHSYWHKIIRGMVSELESKVNPIFADLICPPCIENGKFSGCICGPDNDRRMRGEDDKIPCPLWLERQYGYERNHAEFSLHKRELQTIYAWKVEQFANFWDRNPWTGDKHIK